MAETRGQPEYRGDNIPELPGYRIERQLGRGSMGVVYLAEDLQLRRKVALKILAVTLADDELFRKRFDRESQSAAKLDHPNIVPVYAAGEAKGSLYIAMRYVAGGDLRTLLDTSGPLSLQQATAIVASVADALDAAHAQDMIHRDVKPANILIDRRNDQEYYYLSDFGITKIISAGRSLTSTGQIVGTIDYIAPEQIQGKPVDGRADLYALGCVLYQCLTGLVPFPRDETAAMMWAHVNDEPSPVTAQRPDLPPQIDSIVAKAMAKAPENRYGTGRELATDLRALAADPVGFSVSAPPAQPIGPAIGPAPPPPVPASSTATYLPPTPPPARPAAASAPSRSRKWWWLAASVAVLLLIAGSTVGVLQYFGARFPNTAEQALLSQVPQALSKNCSRDAHAEQDTTNVVASVICSSTGDAVNNVVFTKFTSASALANQYQSAVATAGVSTSSGGSCLNAERAESPYTSVPNQTNGRVLCYQQRGSSFIDWTDPRISLLAQATRLDPDYIKLRDWWAGFEGLPTSGQTAAEAAAQKQVEDAQKQAVAAEAAKQQEAEEAQKQQAAQAAQAQQQLNAAQQQAQQAQQQAEQRAQQAEQQAQQAQQQAQQNQNGNNGGNQNGDNGGNPNRGDQGRGGDSGRRGVNPGGPCRDSRGHHRDNGRSENNGNCDDSGVSDNGGGSALGSQDIQQMIDDAVQRALQQQGTSRGNSSNSDLQRQIEDSVRQSLQQQGATQGDNLQQLIDSAIQQAIQQRAGR